MVPLTDGEVYDYLPETMTSRVRNLASFAGILALDKWTCNADGRQALTSIGITEIKLNDASIGLLPTIAMCQRRIWINPCSSLESIAV